MTNPALVCAAYGIRPGGRIGILVNDDVEIRLLINALDRLACEHVVLDPRMNAIELSAVVAEAGIRLILAGPAQDIASSLPACVASAKHVIDSCIKPKRDSDFS